MPITWTISSDDIVAMSDTGRSEFFSALSSQAGNLKRLAYRHAVALTPEERTALRAKAGAALADLPDPADFTT